MNEAALVRLTEQGLMLVLYGAGPPLLAGALAGALTELVQRRAGIENSGLPGVVRLLVGGLTALAVGPATAGQLVRFASALWTALPTLGQ
jgi:type III secretory pathway component EscS